MDFRCLLCQEGQVWVMEADPEAGSLAHISYHPNPDIALCPWSMEEGLARGSPSRCFLASDTMSWKGWRGRVGGGASCI